MEPGQDKTKDLIIRVLTEAHFNKLKGVKRSEITERVRQVSGVTQSAVDQALQLLRQRKLIRAVKGERGVYALVRRKGDDPPIPSGLAATGLPTGYHQPISADTADGALSFANLAELGNFIASIAGRDETGKIVFRIEINIDSSTTKKDLLQSASPLSLTRGRTAEKVGFH